MTQFHLITPTLDSRWRAVVLFGRNFASYKFALARSLLELARADAEVIPLEELAIPFSASICEHLKSAPKQILSQSSPFLESCRAFNSGEITKDKLVGVTVQRGFANVIDAFHNVNGAEVGTRFFIDEREAGAGIRITEDLRKLIATMQGGSLPAEVEARWSLVETAWSMGVASHLIEFDKGDLFVSNNRRRAVTSCRSALNGYQKGCCFYCFAEFSIAPAHKNLPDVDHFLPWMLSRETQMSGLDGIWNLVLACRECNRGVGGKMARVPSLALLDRLHARNNYLIDSHHPLRETLILQTGAAESDRRSFLQEKFSNAFTILEHLWEPKPLAASTF